MNKRKNNDGIIMIIGRINTIFYKENDLKQAFNRSVGFKI